MKSPETAERVLERIRVLADVRDESGCEHPGDAALAAYLMLLVEHHPEQGKGLPRWDHDWTARGDHYQAPCGCSVMRSTGTSPVVT